MAGAPSATPRTKPPSNVGCVVAIVLLPIVVLTGLVLGTALRGEDDPEEETHDTIAEGEIGGVSWRVDAVRDVDGEVCAFLYRNDAADPLTGGCSFEPEDATFGDQTVVFGRSDFRPGPGDLVETITVSLSGEPSSVDVDRISVEGMDGYFYVTVVDGDVDANGYLD